VKGPLDEVKALTGRLQYESGDLLFVESID